MTNFPEVGYTPLNLRFLIESKGLTQAKIGEFLGVNESTVRRWLMPIGTSSRRDMPHEMWIKLLSIRTVIIP
jgi:DNA-binding transcriptional regulator YiaG